MAALLIPCIIATIFAPEPSDVIPVPRSLEQAVAEPLRDFLVATMLADPAAHRPL